MTDQRGRAKHNWADEIMDLCREADLTIKVPPNIPLHVCPLYETLGVAVEIDRSLPPWRMVRSGSEGRA